jgi:predicted RNA-binding protein
MCIATIYLDTDNQREEVMRDVISVEARDNGFLLTPLIGKEKFLKGKLKSIDFLEEHSVVIEREKG